MSVDRWLMGGLLVMLLLAGSAALNFFTTQKQHESAFWAHHTQKVLEVTFEFSSAIREAHLAQHIYVLNGDEQQLRDFDAALLRLSAVMDELAELIADNPQQVVRVNQLHQLYPQLHAQWRYAIDARPDRRLPAVQGDMTGDDGERIISNLLSVIREVRSEEQKLLEARSADSEQTYRWAQASGAGGALIAMMAIGTFLVRTRRSLIMNSRLAAEKEHLARNVQMLLEQGPDAVFVADSAGHYREVNQQASDLLGWSRAELQSMTIAHLIRPEESKRLGAGREEQLKGAVLQQEWDLLHKDGSFIPVLVSSRILPDGRWIAFVRDYRDRKEAEEALLFQTALVRDITDNATTAIFMMDDEGRCSFMNPAAEKMTGFTFEEVRGGILHDFIHHHHPDGRPFPMRECPIDRALPEEFEIVGHEDTFIRKSGEFFPVKVNAKAIRKQGKAIGTVVEVRDATLEVLAMEALEQADRQKDRFIAILAHELRNPLAPIRTVAGILASPKLTPERLAWSREVIKRQVSHMACLLDDLLDVARITRGKLSITRADVRLGEVVNTAVEIAQPLFDRKKHRFVVDVPSDAQVSVDPLRLSQAIGNLLTNAGKYTDPGGNISLKARADESGLTVSVTDSGVGFRPDASNALFQMFGQLESSRQRAEGGLGIGLALTRGLVELHGGTVTARSGGEGQGSEFVIAIPGAVVRQAGTESRGQPQEPGNGKNYKIVVADDNEDAADSLAALLELAGHRLKVAYGGMEAIRAVEEFRPDVALVDIGMPDLDGYEVARSLRRSAVGQNVFLVAVTGWGQHADKARALEAGFDQHMTKPVDPQKVQKLLSQPLQRAAH